LAASVLGFEATTPFAQGIAATVPALELRDS
jgi:hypothetical protein